MPSSSLAPSAIRCIILDGLLEQQTRLRPVEVMADTAGVSDVVFGLFWLLGYQFSPRLADIGEAPFWRLDSYRRLWGLEWHRACSRALPN